MKEMVPVTVKEIKSKLSGNGKAMEFSRGVSLGVMVENFEVTFQLENGDTITLPISAKKARKMMVHERGFLVSNNGEYTEYKGEK